MFGPGQDNKEPSFFLFVITIKNLIILTRCAEFYCILYMVKQYARGQHKNQNKFRRTLKIYHKNLYLLVNRSDHISKGQHFACSHKKLMTYLSDVTAGVRFFQVFSLQQYFKIELAGHQT